MDIIDQRAEHYGDPRPNHERIAGMWSAYLGTTVTAHDCALMMVMVKLSRSKASAGFHDDDYVDAKGYLDIAQQVR